MAQKFVSQGPKDIWAAILFIIQLIGILALAGYNYSHKEDDKSNDDPDVKPADVGKAVKYLAFMGFVAAVFSVILLFAVRKWPVKFIWVSNIFYIILLALMTLVCIVSGSIFMGIIMVIVTLIWCWWLYSVRDRIPFAATLLKTASTIVKKFHGTTVVAMIFVGFNLLFFVAFAFATYKWANQGVSYGVAFLLMLSFYWTTQVFKNCVHTTTCGTAASWYFAADAVESPTKGALKRTCTTSFGSVCFGSLIVAILKAIRYILRAMARNGDMNAIVACLLECIVGCIESLIEYFNEYAYVYVAVYGHGYIEAAKATFNLIKDCGISAIINDNLIDVVFLFAVIFGGAITGGLSAALAWVSEDGGNWIAFAAVGGFLVGLAITSTVTSLLQSCVKTIFVCFAEEPGALQAVNPELHNELVSRSDGGSGPAQNFSPAPTGSPPPSNQGSPPPPTNYSSPPPAQYNPNNTTQFGPGPSPYAQQAMPGYSAHSPQPQGYSPQPQGYAPPYNPNASYQPDPNQTQPAYGGQQPGQPAYPKYGQ